MENQTIKFSLTAIEAKDLLSADSNGFSDPYFKIPHKQNGVVDIPGNKHKTKWIKKTLNPFWNHTFDVEFNPRICSKLLIKVFDYDRFGKDDLIGTAYIDLEWMNFGQQDVLDEWIPLSVIVNDKKAKTTKNMQKGSVHIKLQVKSRPAHLENSQSKPVQNQMSHPPNHPPGGQSTMQYPIVQPQAQPPTQPLMGQQSSQVIEQPPIIPDLYPSLDQLSGKPTTDQPPIQQSSIQPPIGQPPMQPPVGQPPMQPPVGQPPMQSPVGQPPIQPPVGQPPIQPPVGQPPMQSPVGQPPIQPPVGQPSMQPPMGQPPVQPPMGQPSMQPPMGQPPVQPPVGQPPAKVPLFQSYAQPQTGQPLLRPPTLPSHPMFQSIPGQPQPLNRPATMQQSYYQPPPMQQSMIQPHSYGPLPYAPHPGVFYPPQYSQPPLGHSMMPPPVNVMPPRIPIATQHKRGDALQPGTWIPVYEPVVQVGLGWDFTGRETFDLDASITGFDAHYNVIESIYFSNKKGLKNSVIHFGDNLTGEGEGDDEIIKVILNKVPLRVHFLAVCINSYKKNSLIRAKSAYIRLYTTSYHIGKYILTRTKDCIGLLLGVFERDPTQNVWYFRVMADPIAGNKVTLSYNDIKTLLGNYDINNINNYTTPRIIHPLPGEPLFEFNKWIKLPNRFTYVGLGWHIQQGFNFDLDASILTFDRMNNLMEIIYHEKMLSYNGSIRHYGDNRTGVGEGDDEVLSIDFANVDPNTFTMAVIVNSFKGNSLISIMNAFIRLYDTQRPLGVHVLNNCPDCIGLCMGIFRKDDNGLWYFNSIKEIVTGIVCTQSINDVRFLLDKYPLKV